MNRSILYSHAADYLFHSKGIIIPLIRFISVKVFTLKNGTQLLFRHAQAHHFIVLININDVILLIVFLYQPSN
ncbi:hypothetical protein HZS_7499 [Henneguya salminicola]|nr:hypothetical protein HZS_7499 [Henneguya salminicola]